MAQTVIIGSGIIGLSTAYYLADHQPGSSIHLVDSSQELFASASGYAGGFVAKDWFSSSVASLGKLSFKEHADLAEKEGGRKKWGYAKSTTVAYESAVEGSGDWLAQGTSRATAAGEGHAKKPDDRIPSWLRRAPGDAVNVMDDGDGTAIVDPLKLCQFLLEKCKAAGVQIHHPATALEITTDVRDEVASVRIGYTDSSTESEIPATRILLAAGAWTPLAFATLFKTSTTTIPVSALAGHSLVVKNPHGAGDQCHSVYCTVDALSPELYSRPSGVIYIAGINSSSIPLPPLATGAAPVDEQVGELKELARRFIASEDELEVVRAGLCFRPVTPRGTPILARLRDEQLGEGISTRPGQEGGVFVAVGHGPWGISLSLGTGKVMAEMMQGRELSADVSRLGL